MYGRPSPRRDFEFTGTSRFEVRRVVGQGAVGVVYEAFDRQRNEHVAIKTLRAMSAETLLLLKNEFRTMQDLSHPNLVELGELFEDGGRWFFTMELVEGEDFVRNARPAGRLDAARLRAALVQLARALAALHGAERLHRDIKPSNVLVTTEGRVVVLDFGVVRELDRDASTSNDEGIIGTAHYMAPEQIASEPMGPPADLYAVGSMLYEALTQHPPFASASDVLVAKLQREPPSPRELDPTVPADLDKLCVDLLRMDPARRPTLAEVLRRLDATVGDEIVAAVRAPFVGRRTELDMLRAAADDSRDHAITVVLAGESGAGKSCLARAFSEGILARDPTALVLRGRCYERESVPFKGVDGIVDDLSGRLANLDDEEVAGLLPPHPHLLANVFPVFARMPAFAGARPSALDELVPDEMRRRVFEGIRHILGALAAQRRVVLVIDDLQWANADTLALLRALVSPPSAPRLLLVATLRVPDVAQAFEPDSAPALPGDVRRVAVGALAPAEARALAQQLLGGNAPTEFIDALVEEAKGHPLFLDELGRQGSRTRIKAAANLDDALWARVCRLPADARSIIELLALSGLPLAPAVVAHAADMTRGQIAKVVWSLRTARLARLEGGAADAPIAPYHDRVRESVLGHLSSDEKKLAHGRLARALESADAADANLEALATHWEEAGQPDRAAEYALRAAAAAERALAFEQAARLYERALTLRAFPPHEAVPIQRRCADALTNAGRLADSARLQLTIAGQETELAAVDLRRRAAEQLLVSGHFDEGNRLMQEVVTRSGVPFPTSALTALLLFLWHRLLLRLRGLAFVERAPSTDEAQARALTRLDVTWSAGQGFLMTDNIRGVYFVALSIRLALNVGDPVRLLRASTMEALAAGAPSRTWTKRVTEITRALAEGLKTPYAEAMFAATEGGAAYFWGEWKRGAPLLTRAEQLLRERCVAVTFELSSARWMLLRTLSFLGDVRQVNDRLPALVREAEQREDRYAIINLRTVGTSFVALAANDSAEALRQVRLAEAQLGEEGRFRIQHYFCLQAHCQVDLYDGRAGEALARLDASWKRVRRAMLLRVEILRIQLVDLAARAAIAKPAAPAERAHNLARAERWAAALENELPPWAHALAALVRACIAAARDERDEAVAAFERAAVALAAADMPLHAAAARHRLGVLVGGAAGAAHVTEAEAALRGRGIASPERWTDLIAPLGA